MSQRFAAPEIYLDCNATTPVHPVAVEAVNQVMQDNFGNPSSSHITGLKAKHLLEKTRHLARQVLNASSGDIIFTSGATEGIQTAILSALLSLRDKPVTTQTPLLLYGATEHKAVPNALQHWNQLLGSPAKVQAIPVDKQGKLSIEFIEKNVANAAMICTMAVNNETGVYQDLTLLESVIRKHNPDVLWMVDSVQALGKLALNLDKLSIDYAPFSGHKLYGPKGIGFIYVRENAPYTAVFVGGGQESGKRGGTENLPGIAALAAIFSEMLSNSSACAGDSETPRQPMFHDHQTLVRFRDQLVNALQQSFPSLVFNHPLDASVPTTLNFSVAGISSREVLDLFDAAGIRVSTGSACSSSITRSFVLDAMNLPQWQSESAIRMSFGPATSEATINLACETLAKIRPALNHACLMPQETNDSHLHSGLLQFFEGEDCAWLLLDVDKKQAVLIDPLPSLDKRIQRLLDCQKIQLQAVMFTSQAKQLNYLAGGFFVRHLLPINASISQRVANYQIGNTPIDNEQQILSLVYLNESSNTATCLHLLSEHGIQASISASISEISAKDSSSKQRHIVGFSHSTSQQFIAPQTSLDEPPQTLNAQVVTIDSESAIQQLKAGQATLIDVRESYEFEAWETTQQTETGYALINLPVSRVAEFVIHNGYDQHQPYLLICRSGRRSQQVAQWLAQFGFDQLANIHGGYALLTLAS